MHLYSKRWYNYPRNSGNLRFGYRLRVFRPHSSSKARRFSSWAVYRHRYGGKFWTKKH